MPETQDSRASDLRMTTRDGARPDQLGQLRPANTSNASIYAPILNVIAYVNTIIVCNTGAATILYRLFHDRDGTTYDQTTALVWDRAVLAGSFDILVIDSGLGVRNPGNLAVRTDTANDATFTVYGKELTQIL